MGGVVGDVVLGVIRHVVTSAGGGLVAHGLITGNQLNQGVGAVMVLVGIGFSILQKVN